MSQKRRGTPQNEFGWPFGFPFQVRQKARPQQTPTDPSPKAPPSPRSRARSWPAGGLAAAWNRERPPPTGATLAGGDSFTLQGAQNRSSRSSNSEGGWTSRFSRGTEISSLPQQLKAMGSGHRSSTPTKANVGGREV